MPDLLLFVLGLLVTTAVGVGVWLVGFIEPIESPRPGSAAREGREEGPRGRSS